MIQINMNLKINQKILQEQQLEFDGYTKSYTFQHSLLVRNYANTGL